MQHNDFREVVNTKTYECYASTKDGNKRKYQWDNTNKLLGVDGFNGVKTGVTDAAGPCLAASY
jgi:D-alanyl-D-alanine carboxypeptidase (penicillin-binding protein 5/6)